jgi:hypothetical protein
MHKIKATILEVPEAPAPRCGHQSFVYKESVYFFGGNTSTGIENPTRKINKTILHRFNTNSGMWSVIETGLAYIEKLTAFGCCVSGSRMYSLSGNTEIDSLDKSMSYWMFDFETEDVQWGVCMSNGNHSQRPGGRYGHSVCYYKEGSKEYAVVYCGSSNTLDDVHYETVLYINLENMDRQKVAETKEARSFHSAVVRNEVEMIIFGGMLHTSRRQNPEGKMTGSIASFDLKSMVYSEIEPECIVRPCARRSHGAVMGKNDTMFLFGGYGGNPKKTNVLLNDLWKFDFATSGWTEIDYIGKDKICPRRFFAMEFFGSEIYMFGGVSRISTSNDIPFHVLGELVKIELYSDTQREVSKKLMTCQLHGHFQDVIITTD